MQTRRLALIVLFLVLSGLLWACTGTDVARYDSPTDGDGASDGDEFTDGDADGDEPDGDAPTDGDDPTDGDEPDGDTDGDDPTDGDIPADGDDPTDGDQPDKFGLTWVSIPGGTFQMGCMPQDGECSDNEKPRHSRTVSAFEMTQTEITQDQYHAVMSENPSYFGPNGSGPNCGGDCPVDSVNWHQAKAFCEAVGGRLPSEAEWEYAARAGTETIWICGNESSCIDSVAWYYGNSDTGSGHMTHSVAQKLLNAFGLYDMTGNVWEWVEDCWHENYTGAPSTGEVWGGGDCSLRVLRGGSWGNLDKDVSASRRYGNNPEFLGSAINFGLRCVR